MSRIKSPASVTDPTPEEYLEAYDRLYDAVKGDEQAMRDIRTVYWRGWNSGWAGAQDTGE